MVFTASLRDVQHERDGVAKTPASSLVVVLSKKAVYEIPPLLRGRQVVRPSSLPVVVAQSD